MEQHKFTLPALLALALVACQQPADDNIAIESNNLAAAEVETLPPSDEAGAPASENGMTAGNNMADEPSTPDSIPSQYRGRWGMVAADCTSTRGDDKGLITINEGSIKFYEARATLKEQRPAIATSFSGLYGFTGEGQTWEKVVTLTRTGDTLKRADDEGSYNYRRCV